MPPSSLWKAPLLGRESVRSVTQERCSPRRCFSHGKTADYGTSCIACHSGQIATLGSLVDDAMKMQR